MSSNPIRHRRLRNAKPLGRRIAADCKCQPHCLSLELLRVMPIRNRRFLAHFALRSSEKYQTSDVRETKAGSLALDPVIVRQSWLEAYQYTTDQGATTLNEFARASDPFGRIGQVSIAVEITSVVRASPDSFQVRWVERSYTHGALSATERWTAILSIVV